MVRERWVQPVPSHLRSCGAQHLGTGPSPHVCNRRFAWEKLPPVQRHCKSQIGPIAMTPGRPAVLFPQEPWERSNRPRTSRFERISGEATSTASCCSLLSIRRQRRPTAVTHRVATPNSDRLPTPPFGYELVRARCTCRVPMERRTASLRRGRSSAREHPFLGMLAVQLRCHAERRCNGGVRLPRTAGRGLVASEDGSQPRNGLLRWRQPPRVSAGVPATREVANRRPGADVLGILTKLLESPRAIGPREHANAPIARSGVSWLATTSHDSSSRFDITRTAKDRGGVRRGDR